MLKNLWNLKAFILGFELAFISTFFIGIFWNPPVTAEVYNSTHWYYINRGLPNAWAGMSLKGTAVEFPIIRMPFLDQDMPKFIQELSGENSTWSKIIDLSSFTPVFLTIFLFSYALAFPFGKASDQNRKLHKILIPFYIIFGLGCVFTYFFWFPRI